MLLALLLLLAAASPDDAGTRPPLLAVLQLRNQLPQGNDVDANYLTDTVRAAALEAVPGLRLMTRENVEVLLAQSGRTLEQCEGSCEIETGRLLGADYLVTGEVLKFGKLYRLGLRLHETREGALLAGVQADGRSIDALEKRLRKVLPKLFVPLQKRVAPEPAATAGSDAEFNRKLGDSLGRALDQMAEEDHARELAEAAPRGPWAVAAVGPKRTCPNKVGQMTLSVTPQRTTLDVDGQRWDQQAPLPAGRHRFVASAVGFVTQEQTAELAKGVTSELRFSLRSIEGPAPTDTRVRDLEVRAGEEPKFGECHLSRWDDLPRVDLSAADPRERATAPAADGSDRGGAAGGFEGGVVGGVVGGVTTQPPNQR